MIELHRGNLLEAKVDALVNTVNCVGVMGKGVAAQFKRGFPENTRLYEKACQAGEVQLGKMFVTLTGGFEPRLIINFPTKNHWKANSRLEDIRTGLQDLVRIVEEYDIASIAIPPLGCGLGGLLWEEVRPLIETAFAAVPEVEVRLFAPGGIFPESSPPMGDKPAMTDWKAALILMIDAYGVFGDEATLIEAQKLLYFLSAAGAPLKTNFAKAQYGPYDHGMTHGITSMSGHYILGFADGGRSSRVRLAPHARAEAQAFLEASGGSFRQQIERVLELIEGFEGPYGLELLATVHWVVSREDASTFPEVVSRVQSWNERKRQTMELGHLRIAFDQLSTLGWLNRESVKPS